MEQAGCESRLPGRSLKEIYLDTFSLYILFRHFPAENIKKNTCFSKTLQPHAGHIFYQES